MKNPSHRTYSIIIIVFGFGQQNEWNSQNMANIIIECTFDDRPCSVRQRSTNNFIKMVWLLLLIILKKNCWTNAHYEIFSFGIHRCVACCTRGLRHSEKFESGTRSIFYIFRIDLFHLNCNAKPNTHSIVPIQTHQWGVRLANCWCEVLVIVFVVVCDYNSHAYSLHRMNR